VSPIVEATVWQQINLQVQIWGICSKNLNGAGNFSSIVLFYEIGSSDEFAIIWLINLRFMKDAPQMLSLYDGKLFYKD
jgi:hypothetical protein